MSVEQFFDPDDVIVSKTDLKGRITYVNRGFMRISGFQESELLGQPHSIIRHPRMPRSVFKLLWDTVRSKHEIFAYVINSCKNGDYYWVHAHVTPSLNEGGNIIGYHSNRRVPSPEIIKGTIEPLYKTLIDVEQGYVNAKDGMAAGFDTVGNFLNEQGMEYDEWVATI
jgi:PAS domain S-box-containing protein